MQINGKLRGTIRIPTGLDAAGIEKIARAADFVHKNTEGKTIFKVIVVPGRIVSIIVK